MVIYVIYYPDLNPVLEETLSVSSGKYLITLSCLLRGV